MDDFEYEISDAETETFWHDGAVCFRSVVGGDLLGRLQSAAERARNDPGGFWYTIYLWRRDTDFQACCLDSSLPCLAAQLLRSPRLTLLYDQLFIKPPLGEPTPWHHDLPYWPIEGNTVVSLWLALSEVSPENGGLEFIRGSHRWGRPLRTFSVDYANGQYTPPAATTDDDPIPDFEAERDRHEILCWDLSPGDAIAFHALTLHHASGNRSNTAARTGYALRFMGDDVRYKEAPGMNQLVLNPELKDGDHMASTQYPIVFPRQVAAD